MCILTNSALIGRIPKFPYKSSIERYGIFKKIFNNFVTITIDLWKLLILRDTVTRD